MPAMKITVDTAMRARDVSRPHARNEAQAEENLAAASNGPQQGKGGRPHGGPAAGAARAPASQDAASRPAAAVPGETGTPIPGAGRRRRRRR
jgi:hypothetical protein